MLEIQVLYIMDCPWCMETKKLVMDCIEELGVEASLEEILVDSDEKADKHNFMGSPTVRINGIDIQEEVSKGQCLPCEELAEADSETTEFVKQECKCGCRTYLFRGQEYPYPPKELIKEAIKKAKK